MIAIRGNNFYPSALENVLRRFAEVVEYRVTIDRPAGEVTIAVRVSDEHDNEAVAKTVLR